MNVLIDQGRCVGCGACAADCLRDLIVLESGRARVREGYCMSCGHCVAGCPADAVRLSGGPEEEIRPYRPEEFDIEPERLRNFMQFRRSVRRFQRRPVEEEKLAALLDAARYAPTGANLQQTRYILLRQEKDAVVDLAVKALRGAAERMDTDPLLQGLQPYREMWLEFERAWREEGRDRLFYGAPCVLLTVAGRPRGHRPAGRRAGLRQRGAHGPRPGSGGLLHRLLYHGGRPGAGAVPAAGRPGSGGSGVRPGPGLSGCDLLSDGKPQERPRDLGVTGAGQACLPGKEGEGNRP